MLQWKTQFKGKVKRWHLFYEYKSDINGTGGLQKFLDNYEGWLEKLENDYTRIPDERRKGYATEM